MSWEGSERYYASEVDSCAVGIDFGGTKMLGAVVDADGRVLIDHRIPTPYNGPELLDAISELVMVLEEKVGSTSLGVGVGAAGLVDSQGVLRYAPNVGRLADLDIIAGLNDRLPGRTICVENDNSCATWAEFVLGAGQGVQDMVFVGLGTGIGGGLVSKGRLNGGGHGFAGEAGHMTVEADGIDCVCGKVGCWEAYASGRALGRMGREAATAGRAHAILELAGAIDDIRGEHVTAAARASDAAALAIMDQWAWWIAVGVANLIAILDPELVIVGGGMAGESDLYFQATHAYIDQMVFGGRNRPGVPVVAAQLGPQSGAIGAAMLVHDHLNLKV
jgi:glucokinase